MRILMFVNESTDQEYVIFQEKEYGDDYDPREEQEENARPGFKLKGAWDIGDPTPLGKRQVGFVPGFDDIYIMDR